MNKTPIIIVLTLIALVSGWYFLATQPPPGIETKGGDQIVAWISLATSIASLSTALVTLVLKLLEINHKTQEKS
jgi:H+/Cl- antiporter ClcA